MIRSWCRYLLLLIIAIGMYLLLGGYLFLVILLCTVALPVFSLLAMLLFHHHMRLDFHREKKGSYFLFQGEKWFPLAELHVRVHTENLFLNQTSQEDLVCLTTKQRQLFPLMDHQDRIGKIRLYFNGYEVYDMLGLFRKKHHEKCSRSYYLFPRASAHQDISFLSDMLNDQEHVWEGHVQSGGILEDTHEVKEYQPGDDLRRIHHKLSYKWQKTMIREFASFQQEQLLVYLDLHGSVADCEQVLTRFYDCACEWIEHSYSAIVCWSAMDGNFEEEVNSLESIKRCMQAVLSHPRSMEEDNVLYRSQLGMHLCIRASGVESAADEKGRDQYA